MGKVYAKVKLNKEKNVQFLIKQFFRNFNPESSINIKGNETLIELVFDKEPPVETLEAIGYCEVEELIYGKILEESYVEEFKKEKIKKEPVVTVSQQEKKEVKKVTVIPSEKKRGRPKKNEEEIGGIKKAIEVTSKNKERAKKSVNETNKEEQKPVKENNKEEPKSVKEVSKLVPELNEIASKVVSNEEFAILVAHWLEMKEREEFFKNLVILSMKIEKISWAELEKNLKSNNIKYTNWDKIWSGRQVSEKLKECSITILNFLKETSLFKDYWTEQGVEKSSNCCCKESEKTTEITQKEVVESSIKHESKENIQMAEKVEEFKENDTDTSTTKKLFNDKPRIRMQCMPEIKEFEEVLGNIDMANSIEKRISCVLDAMGARNLKAEDQNNFLEIAKTAVTRKNISIDRIIMDANVPTEKTIEVRMEFTKFVNDFARKYEKGTKIKLATFLTDLQKAIMFDSEIQRIDNFITE